MSNNIEDYIFKDSLPVNTIAMANRLIELLKEQDTNCALNFRNDKQLKRLIWLINSQVHGEFAIIDMSKEWDRLNAEFKLEQEKEKQ